MEKEMRREPKTPPPRRAARSPSNSTTSAQEITGARKIAKAMELRVLGMTFEEIAKAMGEGNASTAYRLVKEGLDRIIREPAEDLRKLEIERLDAALRAVAPLATRAAETIVTRKNKETGKVEEIAAGPDVRALDRYLRISSRDANCSVSTARSNTARSNPRTTTRRGRYRLIGLRGRRWMIPMRGGSLPTA